MSTMRIEALRVRNFKKLRDVEISPDRNVIVIGGKNGAGKSSVIDVILTAIEGGRTTPAEPVRRGAKNASVEIDLGEITVKQTFTKAGGGALTVTDAKTGEPIKGPRGILDTLRGKFLLDPVEFYSKKTAEQAELLRTLIGLDFTDLDLKKRKLLDEKAEADRAVKVHEKNLSDASPHAPDAPAARIDEDAIRAKFDLAKPAQKAADDAVAVLAGETTVLENLRGEARTIAASIKSMEDIGEAMDAEIAALVAKLEARREARVNNSKAVTDLYEDDEHAVKKGKLQAAAVDRAKADLDTARAAIPDTSSIAAELKKAQEDNAKLARNEARAKVKKALDAAEREAEKAKDNLEALADERRERLSSASFPVPGLSIDEFGAVTFGGLPLDQASGAERLRVAVGISLASKSRIRLIPIKDGSLLDADSLEMVRQMAIEADAQVWIERVGTGEEVSIVIEDGEIAGAAGESSSE